MSSPGGLERFSLAFPSGFVLGVSAGAGAPPGHVCCLWAAFALV